MCDQENPAASGPSVRIVDLATDLGLSVATVSRALSGSHLVRPEVAERVREHAARRGYVTNRLARSLRSQHRDFVGFLVPDVQNLAYSIAASATAQHIARSGNQLILAISNDDPDQEFEAIRSLAEAQIGSLIVAPSPQINESSRRLLGTMRVVEFNRSAGLSDEAVLCNERSGFAEATRHLIEFGHRVIGYIGATDTLSNGKERLEGVHDELGRHGLELRPEHTKLLPLAVEAGAQAAAEVLNTPERPTALIVGGSNLSVGTARAVRRLGLNMPEDLSLIVYGDADWGELLQPPLTTVKAPYLEMARVVTDAVSGLMSPEPVHAGEVRLDAELIVRASTGPPP